MAAEIAEAKAEVERFRKSFARLKDEIGKEIVGYSDVVEKVLMCLFAGGHVLLEGVPGLGKTLLVRTLGKALHLSFSRIQFTPDLMPADIIGTSVVTQSEVGGEKVFRFQKGPVFAHLVLADEINRATPKTQSALLEAMQEHSVTVGGRTHILDEPFFVLGTQNPLEMEGTYPLPEAQVDRFFFKLKIGYLGEDDLVRVIDRTTANEHPQVEPVLDPDSIAFMRRLVRDVAVADHVKRYAVRLVLATHPESDVAPAAVKKYVKYGASPRAIQTLILGGKVAALIDGRSHLACEDIRGVVLPALRHRVLLNFEGEAEDLSTDILLKDVLAAIPEIPAR